MGCVTGPSVRQQTVFITHGHMDHVGALHLHAAQRALLGLPAPKYFVPPCLVGPLEAAFAAFRAMDGSDLPCSIHPMVPGDRVILHGKAGSTWIPADAEVAATADATKPVKFVTCWATAHRVPSQGYIVWQTHTRLREQFRAPGVDIPALRKTLLHAELFETTRTPLLAHTGDTTIEGVLCCADALRARVLIMEMTSLDDALPAAVTRERGHIHLQDVVDHAEAFAANEAVMLMHFSRRYKAVDIKEKLQAALPASLHAKVHAAIGDFFASTTDDGVE